MRTRSFSPLLWLLLSTAALSVTRGEEEPSIDDVELEVGDDMSRQEAERVDEPNLPKSFADQKRPAAESKNIFSFLMGQKKASLSSLKQCERIAESPLPDDDKFFQFHQDDVRLDPNELVKTIFQIISHNKIENVKKVMVEWAPHIKNEVGNYPISTTVATTSGEEKCYEIIITVLDTNECTYQGLDVQWQHQCSTSSVCVNDVGGYHCACDGNRFALKGSGTGKCHGEKNSKECCGGDSVCRAAFECHSDSCAFHNCHLHASCAPGQSPNTFTCECPSGFRDVGPKETPGLACSAVDHCAVNKCPAGCSCESITNRTMDGYFCHPEPGHSIYYPSSDDEWETKPLFDADRLDKQHHLCVWQASPPVFAITGNNPVSLIQGSVYEEFGVKIIDENTGDLKRRFTTDYGGAVDLIESSGFVKKCGRSEVTYSMDTPWIKDRPTISTIRVVEVTDVNECTYTGDDSDFRHKCTGLALCVNLNCSSESGFGYFCECREEGYETDNNQSCADRRAPIIECVEKGQACGYTHVWAVMGAGAIAESKPHPTVLTFDGQNITLSWVESQLAKMAAPKLRAFDLVPVAGGQDLVVTIEEIVAGPFVDNDNGIWTRPYTAVDSNGNKAVFNVTFKVTVVTAEMLVTLLEIDQPNSTKGNENCARNQDGSAATEDLSSSKFAVWTTILVIIILMSAEVMNRVLAALQCLLIPSSILQRERFEVGMHTLLAIQSAGTLTPSERSRLIEAKWVELRN